MPDYAAAFQDEPLGPPRAGPTDPKKLDSDAGDGGRPEDHHHIAASEVPHQALKPRWKRLLPWTKWVVSAGLIALVLSLTEITAVLEAIRGTDPVLALAALGLFPVGIGISALRWQGLLAAQGVRAPFWYLVGSGFVAAFARLFLPSTIGGDVVRAHDSWRVGASKSVAVATIGVDRLFGLLAMALLACTALAFNPGLESIPSVRWLAWGAAVGMAAAIAWIFLPSPRPPAFVLRMWRLGPASFRRLFDKLFGALEVFSGRHLVLARSLVLSLVFQLNVVLFYWLLALALGLELTFAQMLVAVPVAVFVMMIPVTINGIGLRESIWIVLLGVYGFEKADAVALSWIELGLFVTFGMLGGILYAARK